MSPASRATAQHEGGRGKCRVCHSPEQTEIDAALVAGMPFRQISKRFRISTGALVAHKANHLSPAIKVLQQARLTAGASKVLDRLEHLAAHAQAVLEQTKGGEKCATCGRDAQPGNPSQGLAAIREARATLELIGRITGELDDRPKVTVNIQSSQEWVQIRTIVVEFIPPERRQEFGRRLELLEGGAS